MDTPWWQCQQQLYIYLLNFTKGTAENEEYLGKERLEIDSVRSKIVLFLVICRADLTFAFHVF